MISKGNLIVSLFSIMFLVLSCATSQPKIPVDLATAQLGTQVDFRGKPIHLLGSPISVGKPLPPVELVNAMTMNSVDLSKERDSILFSALCVS